MFVRSILLSLVVAVPLLLSAQQTAKPAKRDAQAMEILQRTANVAGGYRSLSAVRSLTESGEIRFYWGESVKGPVTIRSVGGNHFRMEADLPDGKSTWIVKDGVGSESQADKTKMLSRDNAINLCNLTYPIGHVAAALADSSTEVSFVDVEKRDDRSVYRLRLKGRLGLAGDGSPVAAVKDLIIDALTFELDSVEDHPYPTYSSGRKNSEVAPRAIDFGDFRLVSGVRVPFFISTKLHGQMMLAIHLSEVNFNSALNSSDFQINK